MNNTTLIVTCLCIGAAVIGGCGMKKKTSIIAHRGASYIAPENTVASAKKAWEVGADAVEIDIYYTKDERIMVMHDGSAKRTTGVDVVLANAESDSIRMLDAGSWKGAGYAGEKIPFLDEITATVPSGKKLYIEIKCGPEVLSALKKAIDDSGIKERIVIIGFGFDTVAEAKKLMPGIPAYWLTGTQKNADTGAFDPLDIALVEKVKSAGLDGFDVHFGGLTQEFADAVHKAGLGLYAWTVDDPLEAKRLVSLGVDGITTNRPGWLREQAGL